MMIGSLFSGIGGLELGLERSGLGHTAWQVEQSEFCRGILAKHWPHAERFDDVCAVGADTLPPVDLICGGFPCQDISSAGKGAGLAGDRSGLWYEFARIVEELRPAWVVVENVASGAKHWVDAVRGALERLGYATLPVPVAAANVGAPHLRRRIFIVAHAGRQQLREQQGRCRRESRTGPAEPSDAGASRAAADANRNGKPAQPLDAKVAGLPTAPGLRGTATNAFGERRLTGRHASTDAGRQAWSCAQGCCWTPPVSPVCGMDDGPPRRVDRLRALGNAVVPQCAEVAGHVIREVINTPTTEATP